jgi:hypothetical protein
MRGILWIASLVVWLTTAATANGQDFIMGRANSLRPADAHAMGAAAQKWLADDVRYDGAWRIMERYDQGVVLVQ